jgi:uncharacterized protein YqgV (UPF0045/DUF77 family)
MKITLEISYYPLVDKYNEPVKKLISRMKENEKINIEAGVMSTLISGNYNDVMNMVITQIEPLMEEYPSVFNLKISNACK